MKFRLFLAAWLTLSCLALVGCGGGSSSSTTTAPAGDAPLSPAQVAEAQAEQDRASADESAQQQANPVGKQPGKKSR